MGGGGPAPRMRRLGAPCSAAAPRRMPAPCMPAPCMAACSASSGSCSYGAPCAPAVNLPALLPPPSPPALSAACDGLAAAVASLSECAVSIGSAADAQVGLLAPHEDDEAPEQEEEAAGADAKAVAHVKKEKMDKAEKEVDGKEAEAVVDKKKMMKKGKAPRPAVNERALFDALVLLARVDGSWILDNALVAALQPLSSVGSLTVDSLAGAVAAALTHAASPLVAGTLTALVVLRTCLAKFHDEWEFVVEKAMAWLHGQGVVSSETDFGPVDAVLRALSEHVLAL